MSHHKIIFLLTVILIQNSCGSGGHIEHLTNNSAEILSFKNDVTISTTIATITMP